MKVLSPDAVNRCAPPLRAAQNTVSEPRAMPNGSTDGTGDVTGTTPGGVKTPTSVGIVPC